MNGIHEAGGSIPPSSTSSKADFFFIKSRLFCVYDIHPSPESARESIESLDLFETPAKHRTILPTQTNPPLHPTTKPDKRLCAFVRSNRTAWAMAKRSYFVPQTSSHPRTL